MSTLQRWMLVRHWRASLTARRGPPYVQGFYRNLSSQPKLANAEQDGTNGAPQASSDEMNSTGRKRRKTPSTTGWTAFTKSNRLGRASSVLILRDAEQRRGNRDLTDEVIVQQKPLQDVDVDEVLRSIATQRQVPGQEEVNNSINSMRPRTDRDETAMLSQTRFEDMIEQLAQKFDKPQLSRYVAIHEEERLRKEMEERELRKMPFRSSTLDRKAQWSEWHPTEEHGRIARSGNPNLYRGKKAIANVLLRSIWGAEVLDERQSLGSMSLYIRGMKARILAIGGTFLLSGIFYSC